MERMNAGPIIRFQIDKIVCIGASKSSGLRPGIEKETVRKTVMSDLFDVSKETILVTGAILLLASKASRYMTTSVITVDGGFLLN